MIKLITFLLKCILIFLFMPIIGSLCVMLSIVFWDKYYFECADSIQTKMWEA